MKFPLYFSVGCLIIDDSSSIFPSVPDIRDFISQAPKAEAEWQENKQKCYFRLGDLE